MSPSKNSAPPRFPWGTPPPPLQRKEHGFINCPAKGDVGNTEARSLDWKAARGLGVHGTFFFRFLALSFLGNAATTRWNKCTKKHPKTHFRASEWRFWQLLFEPFLTSKIFSSKHSYLLGWRLSLCEVQSVAFCGNLDFSAELLQGLRHRSSFEPI